VEGPVCKELPAGQAVDQCIRSAQVMCLSGQTAEVDQAAESVGQARRLLGILRNSVQFEPPQPKNTANTECYAPSQSGAFAWPPTTQHQLNKMTAGEARARAGLISST